MNVVVLQEHNFGGMRPLQLMKKTNMVSSHTFVQSVLESWFKGVNYSSIVVHIPHSLFMKVIFVFLLSVLSLCQEMKIV